MKKLFLASVFLLVALFSAFVYFRNNVMAATEPADPEQIPVKVMVVIYDPILESQGGVRTHQYFGWNDPATVNGQIVSDLNSKSHGRVNFQVVETVVRDEWPLHTNGQRYTDATYISETNALNWTLGPGNYNAIITDNQIEQKINNGDIDEVWLWGGPGFGWWEATTAGNGAYSTNGGPVTGVNSKVFSIMGFSYEREVEEGLESFGHRVEGIMKRVYGSWAFGYGTPPAQAPAFLHSWDAFTVKNFDPGSLIGCGFAHGSLNSPTYDGVNNYWAYDWSNTTNVSSTCNDWLNYPYLTGSTSTINCTAWGCDGHTFLKWWFERMPFAAGTYDGYLANWWRYIVDTDQYKDKLQISQLAVDSDLAENNAGSWSCTADQSSCSLSNETTTKKYGASSVKMTTSGAFDSYMKYPSSGTASWNLEANGSMSFWAYATNTNQNGFQGPIKVYLKNSSGAGYLYTSADDFLDNANNIWYKFNIPFGGNSTWTRTTIGSPSSEFFEDVDYTEIHADTWGAGFTLTLDGLGFVKDFSEETYFNYPTEAYNWDCTMDVGGVCQILGVDAAGQSGGRASEYYIYDVATSHATVHSWYPRWSNLEWAPPQPMNANVNDKTLVFWAKSDNPNSGKFENSSPTVVLRTGAFNGSSYYTYTPTGNLLNGAIGRWQRFEIPVAGNSVWTRTSSGTPSLSDIDWIEIKHDSTGNTPYHVWFDGVRFENNDTTNPTVSITSPTNGTGVSGVVTVAVSAGDDTAMKRVDLLVDGEFVLTDAIAPYVFKWDSGTVSSGSHTLTAKAYDMAGRVATSTGISVTVSGSAGQIFSDGFESGGSSSWTGETDSENDLTVTTSAALDGSYGIAALIDNTTTMFLEDETPTNETVYRASFKIDPNSITMANSDNFTVMNGRDSAASFAVHLGYSSTTGYRVRTQVYDDSQGSIYGSWENITDAPHEVSVEWKAASAGANNGHIKLSLDGTEVDSLTTVDNDTRKIDEARFGAVANIDSGTSGTFFLDSFESENDGGSPTPTPTPTPPPGGDEIFSDGFESGNTGAWSSETDTENDLSATTGSALNGTYGLAAVIDNTTNMYVTDDTPDSESRYRARFYIDPNSISMSSTDTFTVFQARTNDSSFQIHLNYTTSSGYRVRSSIYNDAGVATNGSMVSISDAPHYIEVDWKAASAPGANDGYITLWVDGVEQYTQSGIDNDTKRVGDVRFGAAQNIDSGTVGTIYLDKFKSTKTQYIGP